VFSAVEEYSRVAVYGRCDSGLKVCYSPSVSSDSHSVFLLLSRYVVPAGVKESYFTTDRVADKKSY